MSISISATKREAGGPQEPLSLAPSVVVVPLLNLGLADDMLGLAAGIMRQAEMGDPEPFAGAKRIVVLSVVEVPPDEPLAMGLDMARSYRALLDFLPSSVEVGLADRVRVDRVVKVARDVAGAMRQAAEEARADLVLLYWKGHAREPKRHLYGRITDALLENPPCSVMLTRIEGWKESRRVLLPVRGGPSAEQALDLGVALAERRFLPVTVLHNVPRTPTAPNLQNEAYKLGQVEALGEEPYIVFNTRLRAVQESVRVPVESILTRLEDPLESLLSEAQPDDLVIMSVPPLKKGRGYVPNPAESLALQVSAAKGPPLLLLNTPTEIQLSTYSKRMVTPGTRAGGKRAGAKRWVDMPFEHWFVAHTYHGDEFRDPDEFVKAKLASGLTLSVVVLTSNDAMRIHSVIMGLRRVLQEMHPIADQIVVVDAASGDGTRDIARELGVEVYDAADILPLQGDLHGRGESWWKSLAVAKSDLIVWLDPRARRFHPSTALSLVGPLLRSPELQMVEAFAGVVDVRRNPTAEFSPVDVSWGGFVIPRRDEEVGHAQVRVQALKPSDLDALDASQIAMLPPRTIFQVLCPALAGVISPFTRDMTARRDVMLDLPVFAGDNAEVGVLLSVASEFGTNAIAQVELGHAQPAPPPQPGLRSAIDLLQVMARRLTDDDMRGHAERLVERLQREVEGKRTSSAEEGDTSRLFEVRALGPVQRPPMRGIAPGVERASRVDGRPTTHV